MLARLGQRVRIGDRPSLEEQVSGFLLDEHCRTVVAVRTRIDRQEL